MNPIAANPLSILLISLLAIVAAVLLLIFVLVPLLKGVGGLIGGAFRLIGWLFRHLFEFVFGTCGDLIRFVGGIPTFLVLALLTVVNVIIGRWSAAGHFAEAAKRECRVGTACLYRAILRRPLKLLLLDGLLEGLEQRLPEAMQAAPTADTPNRLTGQFDGYSIVGSLRAGGSGAKLYIAQPTPEKIAKLHLPERVVIKSFALNDGSSLPQIVRESRALECAKSLGHVLDHGMSDHRFFYVMPYIPGDHLGIITRQFHGQSDSSGLGSRQLAGVMGYMSDLLTTLAAYHRGGLWHKDVKPENVIVHDQRAHLVDLGLVTSLHSAMTLTTHGTEYFRDPEMVRLALRGVKVHQVDGAKFDIYGVGAVLYYMLENTFPAHGGLSAFNKRSPEALRWIVRRAMADYQKRYETAEAMLADLKFVGAAADPFALRPIDLPSMRGGAVHDEPAAERQAANAGAAAGATVAAAAGATVPPNTGRRAWGISIGPEGLRVGDLSAAEASQRTSGRRTERPRLRVFNWWTGAYNVDDDGSAFAGGDGGSSAWSPEVQARAAAAGARRVAQNARQTAREQIRAARGRVTAMRLRAMQGGRIPHRSIMERQPSAAVGALTALVLTLAAVFLVSSFSFRAKSSPRPSASATTPRVALAPTMPEFQAIVGAFHAQAKDAPATANRGILVVDDHDPRQYDSATTLRLHNLVGDALGGRVLSDSSSAAQVRPFLTRVKDGRETAISELDRLLQAKGCSALIVFTGDPAGAFLAYPPLPGTLPLPVLAGRKLVLVNDHPRAAVDAIQARVQAIRMDYQRQGGEFVDPEPDIMAELIVLLQRRQMDATGKNAGELPARLAQLRLGGLLHVTAPLGAGPSDEVRSELISAAVSDEAAATTPEPAPAAGS